MIKEHQLSDHQRETAMIKVRTLISNSELNVRGLTSITPASEKDKEKGADFEVCIDDSTRFLLRIEVSERNLEVSKEMKAYKTFAFLLVEPQKDPRQILAPFQQMIAFERNRRAH